jgi:hypothetical protein
MASGLRDAARRNGSFIETVKAVGASFFGVRGGRAHMDDLARLNPVHVIIVGLVLGALFVLSLVLIVKLVVA